MTAENLGFSPLSRNIGGAVGVLIEFKMFVVEECRKGFERATSYPITGQLLRAWLWPLESKQERKPFSILSFPRCKNW